LADHGALRLTGEDEALVAVRARHVRSDRGLPEPSGWDFIYCKKTAVAQASLDLSTRAGQGCQAIVWARPMPALWSGSSRAQRSAAVAVIALILHHRSSLIRGQTHTFPFSHLLQSPCTARPAACTPSACLAPVVRV
jgi:hypothetical protein